MRSAALHPQLRVFLDVLDEAYEKKAWHGPNLRGSLRGVSAREAAWRPAPGRHNIWEIAIHAAYWKYAVRRRLVAGKRGSFARKGSNWFVCPKPLSKKAWREGLAVLARVHAGLREAVAALSPAALHKRSSGSKSSPALLVRGVAMHDVYHAGQIQLLKRLCRKRHFG